MAGWQTETIDTVGGSTSLAFDASGKPAISYVGPNNLKYAHFNGSVWDITTVDEWAMEEGGATSLAFDTSGKPAISYYDLGDSVLKYASFNGAAWDITTVDSGGDGSMDESSSLAFDSSGNPAIAYAMGISKNDSNIKYAHFNGATWDITTIDAGSGPSLAFDADGVLSL